VIGVNGAERPDAGFTHPAFFYSGPEEYLAGVGGFVRSGLAAQAPVLVAVPPERLAVLRDHLGHDADHVQLLDMAEIGQNPGRILAALTDFVEHHAPARTWLVGEPIWASRSPAEIREAIRHEALINLAFAGVPTTILCPYDRAGLTPATLTDAERTHPMLLNHARTAPYTDPLTINAECDVLAGPEPAAAERLAFGPSYLHMVRRRAAEFGRAAGLTPERAIDLKLAVGEAAANTLRYGGGLGKVTLYRNGSGVIAEIRDRGRLTNPLAGRRRPPPDATGGRGLWMIHQLCDLVELGPGLMRLHISG
jgi:anti-sigma regulatory factor (Ser/Thr protein kinase)